MRFLSVIVSALLLISLQAAAQEPAEYRLLTFDGQPVKWGEPRYGADTIVRYAFITQNSTFEDARNCRSMGPVDPVIEAAAVPAAAFENAVASSFATWQAVAGVRFERTNDPGNADILIGVDLGHHGWAHADVLAPRTSSEIRTISRSLICLNPEKPWKIGFGNRTEAQDVQYTFTHEIGHAIGLNHASPSGQIMSFTYGEDFIDLQPGDIDGVRALYGPAALSNAAVAGIEGAQTR